MSTTPTDTYTKRGKWRTFTFGLAFREGPAATVELTYGADTDVRRVFRRYYGERTDVTKPRPPGRALFVEDAGCLAEIFPSDWKLPMLADALDKASILPLLSDSLDYAPEGSGFSAQAFRFKAHRRTLIGYTIGTGSSRREFIGKLFADDARAQRGWHVLEQLFKDDRTRDLVPRPAAFDLGMRLLIMDRMPGRAMSDLPASDTRSHNLLIDSAARSPACTRCVSSWVSRMTRARSTPRCARSSRDSALSVLRLRASWL